MSKNFQNNIDDDKDIKKHEWEDYLNINDFKMHPANYKFKYEHFTKMPEFFEKNKKGFSLDDYYDHTGVSEATHREWRNQDPIFQACHDKAKRIIARRLKQMFLSRNLNINQGAGFILPHYDNDTIREYDRRNKLKQDSEARSKEELVEALKQVLG